SRRDLLLAQKGHLVWQADANERATCALRTVLERRRNLSAGRHEPQAVDRVARELPELFIECDSHALAALHEVQNAFLARVPVLLEDQTLYAKLDALRIVRTARHMRPLAALVIHWCDAIAFALDEIHAGDQAET